MFSAKTPDRLAEDISGHPDSVRTDILADAVGDLKHDRPADDIPRTPGEPKIYDERTLVPGYEPDKWVDEL